MRHKIGIEIPISDIDYEIRSRSERGAVVLPTGPDSEKYILSSTALFLTELLDLPEESDFLEVSTEAISINNAARRSDDFIHLPVAEDLEVKGFVLDRRNQFNDHEITFWGEADSEHFPKTGVCQERHLITGDTDAASLAKGFFDGYLAGFDERTSHYSTYSTHILGDDCFIENIDDPNGSKLHLLEVFRVVGAVALDRVSKSGRELSCWSMPA